MPHHEDAVVDQKEDDDQRTSVGINLFLVNNDVRPLAVFGSALGFGHLQDVPETDDQTLQPVEENDREGTPVEKEDTGQRHQVGQDQGDDGRWARRA